MKQIGRRYVPGLLLVLASGMMIVGLGSSEAVAVNFGLYQINFLGATYDSGTVATTFTYQVIAAVDYGIDDWTVELTPDCFGPGDIIDASEAWVYAGPDTATGIYGITFTTPYAPGETRTVWFRLPGDLSTTLVRVDVEYTCSHWTKEMEGPECGGQPGPCTPPECDVTPDRDSVCVGSDVTFTADATGTPPLTYCWQKEPYADPCISATNQLTIYGATSADEGTYRVMVTNECGEDICYVQLIVDECPGGEGKSPGYWGNQLAIYLGLKNGKLKEPDVASYAAQYGYTAQSAYDIMNYGGDDPVAKLHRQLMAAKLSTAAGYLTDMAELLEWGQYMVANPWEFTEQEILDAKDLFEALHD
jgi:hypothetical protein